MRPRDRCRRLPRCLSGSPAIRRVPGLPRRSAAPAAHAGRYRASTRSRHIVFSLSGDGKGGLHVSGEAIDDAGSGNRLQFKFDIDRNGLPAICASLEHLLVAFPVIDSISRKWRLSSCRYSSLQDRGILHESCERNLSSEVDADGAGQNEEATLGRMTIDKTFSGELEGTSKGHMLAAGTNVQGSAGCGPGTCCRNVVRSQRYFRSAAQRHHDAGAPHLTVTVVPDSATDGLEGLSGRMAIDISEGRHSYDFEVQAEAACWRRHRAQAFDGGGGSGLNSWQCTVNPPGSGEWHVARCSCASASRSAGQSG